MSRHVLRWIQLRGFLCSNFGVEIIVTMYYKLQCKRRSVRLKSVRTHREHMGFVQTTQEFYLNTTIRLVAVEMAWMSQWLGSFLTVYQLSKRQGWKNWNKCSRWFGCHSFVMKPLLNIIIIEVNEMLNRSVTNQKQG